MDHRLLRQVKGYGPESNTWVRENDMDADELIDDYLAEHVDMVNGKKKIGSIIQTPGRGRNSRVGTNSTNSGTYLGDTTTLQWTLNRHMNR